MVSVAKEVCQQDTDISFIVSKAEDIPVTIPKMDIVTAAGAIQWIDRVTFLKNIRNVMAENGYMLIYILPYLIRCFKMKHTLAGGMMNI